jgi:hypothetical protein
MTTAIKGPAIYHGQGFKIKSISNKFSVKV